MSEQEGGQSPAHANHHSVRLMKSRPGRLPYYAVDADRVPYGLSLGNGKLWVTTRNTGAVESIFSVDLGLRVTESLLLTYATPGEQLTSRAALDAARKEKEVQFATLRQEEPATLRFHPAYQRRDVRLGNALSATETLLLPRIGPPDPPVLLLHVRLHNWAGEAQCVRVTAYLGPAGETDPDIVTTYDPRLRALLIHNESRPEIVRAFQATSRTFGTVRYEATFDGSQAYADHWARQLQDNTDARGAVLTAVQAEGEVGPDADAEVTFVVAISTTGEKEARRLLRENRGFTDQLQRTEEYLTPTLSVATVETPDTVINEAVFWAKVNMIRVMANYPQGRAFTNDPGSSSHIVCRDAMWFLHGCDHLLPDFSRDLLRLFARTQYLDGKIVETCDAVTGERADYGLNINDDTPLFVIGLKHHYLATGDRTLVEELYPAAEKAAHYLLSQRDDRGLVHCTSTDSGARGIASWRNVIPNYQISGAVTEINAECHAALVATADLAAALHRKDQEEYFRQEAGALRAAINEHLFNPNNGMYLLNIDPSGNRHTEVTADEVFPVMFDVADDDVAYRIVSRLNAGDFMTPAGLRAVSRESPEYDPARDSGLRGGVWPGSTFWYAFAAAPYHPGEMAAALHASFAHYLADPLAHNTLPGEFAEWFDGETLTNRGMRLSPWEPARLLWAAVEGACGARGTGDGCECHPLIPPDWMWLGLRRWPQAGRHRSFFIARQDDGLHLYSDSAVSTDHPVEEYAEEVSDRVHLSELQTHRIALRRPGETLICIGSADDRTVMVSLKLRDLLDGDRLYRVSLYSSELRDWRDHPGRRGRDLTRLSLPLDSHGFRLLRLIEA